MMFLGSMSAELATAYEEEKALGLPNEEDDEFFERLYPRLEAWFQWFNTSQTGVPSPTYLLFSVQFFQM